jgi:hypothetical protein
MFETKTNKERFIPGEKVYSIAFKKMYTILEVTDDNTIWIVDKSGNSAEWLIKDFIPEIEYTTNKFNL